MAAKARNGAARPADGPAELALGRESRGGERVLHHLADFLDAFMWQADPATLTMTFVTGSVEDLLGYPVSCWLGGPGRWSRLIHRKDRKRVVDCLRATAADGRDREVEFRVRTTDRRTLLLRHAVRLLSDPSGEPELWGLTTDVTADRRVKEELRVAKQRYRALTVRAAELQRRALHDPLTGLPNRILLNDRLQMALRRARRAGEPCALLVIDLDRFKEVNDTLGHQTGDVLLRTVADCLRMTLREQDTSARLGGDEFAVVLPSSDTDGAIHTVRRFLEALRSSTSREWRRYQLGASVGIAVFPRHGEDAEALLSRADDAMYRAKESGRDYAVAMADDAAHLPHAKMTG